MYCLFLALTKSIGFRSDVRTDDRCYWLSRISSISSSLAIPTVYPRMFSIDEHSIKVFSHMFLLLVSMEMIYKLHSVTVCSCCRMLEMESSLRLYTCRVKTWAVRASFCLKQVKMHLFMQEKRFPLRHFTNCSVYTQSMKYTQIRYRDWKHHLFCSIAS